MMKTEKIKLELLETNSGQIDGLPANPRIIRDDRFKKLVKSIQDDPEMLELRELIVMPNAGTYVVIGGNMRLEALKHIGAIDAPCKVLPDDTEPVKLRAYTMKDNIAYGEMDFDMLANEWDFEELEDWGTDLPDFIKEKEPEEPKDKSDSIEEKFIIEIECSNESEQEQLFNKLTGEGLTCRVLTL